MHVAQGTPSIPVTSPAKLPHFPRSRRLACDNRSSRDRNREMCIHMEKSSAGIWMLQNINKRAVIQKSQLLPPQLHTDSPWGPENRIKLANTIRKSKKMSSLSFRVQYSIIPDKTSTWTMQVGL